MRYRVGGIVAAAAVAVCLALSFGCSNRKSVYPAHGTVVDAAGNPVAGALVVFHPAGGDSKDPDLPRATTDEDGSYKLTTYANGDGAPAGDYTVTIEVRPRKKTPFERESGDQLGGRFAKAEGSPFHFKIEAKSENSLDPIQLP
jgi:hypothetical protein